MHQRSAGTHHFSGTRRLQEPSDGEQSVQFSAHNKLFFSQYVGNETEYHRD